MEKNNSNTSYLKWNEYFMAIANLVKSRSKDPCTQVGACIVRDNKILSTGYNGFPCGLSDEKYPWGKNNPDETDNKYFYVVHAELNAILNSNNNIKGSTIFVTKFPCNECAKAIIQSGISKVIYQDPKLDLEDNKVKAVFSMLHDAGITIEEHKYACKLIEIIV